ncbi:MAG: hypothetical protein F6K65_11225 [Moorea sp. SIO3C2]|nr:hypothetical protein [Moorena sp. SIO3C2]
MHPINFLPCSLFPVPCSLFPTPYSLFPTPYSLLPTPNSLLPPITTFKNEKIPNYFIAVAKRAFIK